MTQVLKHWDLREHFYAEQIACLAVGVDPSAPAGDRAPGMSNGAAPPHDAAVLLRDIQRAASAANGAAFLMMRKGSKFEFDQLPPKSLLSDDTLLAIWEAAEALESGKQIGSWKPNEPFLFSRDRVADWLQETGFDSSYDFRRRIKRVVAADTVDSVSRPVETKERNTLLVIIGVMAHMAKIDLAAASKAGEILEGEAATLGVSLSRRSAMDHLKRVEEAMAARSR